MEYTVERIFNNLNHTCCGAGYRFYENVFQDLIYTMTNKIGHSILGDEYRNLRFVMNPPFYHEFYRVCQISGHYSHMYRSIKISPDSSPYICDTESPTGVVRLIYEEPYYKNYCVHDAEVAFGLWTSQLKNKPHIDHVKFNGPATIVFWKDGTKTVVKYDGKGHKDYRQAILYAFIRKIYGEGKPYHNILNEIEEVMEQELWMPLPEE